MPRISLDWHIHDTVLHQLEIKCVSLTGDDETIVVNQIVAARNVSPVQTAEYLCSLFEVLLITTDLSVEHRVREKAISPGYCWIYLDCIHVDIAMARRPVYPLPLHVGVSQQRRIAPSYIGNGLDMRLF